MVVSDISQILMLFEWFILLLLFQLSVWPLLSLVNKKYALPLSFPISILLATLLSWYLALGGLPVPLILVPLILMLVYAAIKRSLSVDDFRNGWKWYILFYGTFILTLITKILYNSAIDISYEKFMDSMILSSMVQYPQIPPLDGWYAGGFLTWYYYLASWVFAVPAHILSIPASVMYNFAIPTIFAASAVMIYACSSLLLTRFRYLPLFLLFISYPGFFALIPVAFTDRSPLRFILDGTVRILPGAVTENPLSALLIGSPRPYAVALMIQCLILFLLIYLYLNWKEMGIRSRVGTAGGLILCLGTLIPLHTWDYIIFLPLTVAVGFLLSYHLFFEDLKCEGKNSGSFKLQIQAWVNHVWSFRTSCSSLFHDPSTSAVLFISILTPIISLLVYLPFLFEMENQRMQGISLVLHASEPIPFLLVHGLFLLLLLLYLRNDILKKPVLLGIPLIVGLTGFISAALVLIPAVYLLSRRFGRIQEILAFTGLMCVLCCEFVAIVQNGTPDRANTTYKFYFAAWVLLGVSTFTLLGEMLGEIKYFFPVRRYTALSTLLIAGAILFPAILLSSGPVWLPSLDGTAFVSKYIGPEESHALDYLRTLPPGEVLFEGVVLKEFDQDESAKYFSRISSFTGIHAVMGSFYREKTYRGDNATHERGEDSVQIYLQPEKAAELMEKYNASLLYIGTPEIMAYKIKDPEIYVKYGFTQIFHENSTVIWRYPHHS